MRMYMAAALVASVAGSASAAIITQWDFNGVQAGLNLANPATSIGFGTASLLAGNTAAFAAGSPNDPAVSNDNRWNSTTYAAQGVGSGTRGVEYAVSTVGFQNISFGADIRNSNTSSAFIQILAALDGINFTTSLGIFSATAGDQWNVRTATLGAGADNNANLKIRVVSIFAPGGNVYVAANPGSNYATTGTIGYDLVTFSGERIPTPGSVALFGIASLAAVRRRRAM